MMHSGSLWLLFFAIYFYNIDCISYGEAGDIHVNSYEPSLQRKITCIDGKFDVLYPLPVFSLNNLMIFLHFPPFFSLARILWLLLYLLLSFCCRCCYFVWKILIDKQIFPFNQISNCAYFHQNCWHFIYLHQI